AFFAAGAAFLAAGADFFAAVFGAAVFFVAMLIPMREPAPLPDAASISKSCPSLQGDMPAVLCLFVALG
ncbi:hypothetical protein SB847_20485, partial [Bacillus sp. SIMBA_026]|uniref:hypothetical protein n=1 Tax=Bacillus sp. SIMBA_026 TaxID=3085769 RepID=UPI00397C1C32